MTTFAVLKADVAKWASRTDLDDRMGTFCALFESRLNRELRVRRMEAAFTGTIVDNVLPLPVDWLEFKRLWPASAPMCQMLPQTLEVVASRTEGTPVYFSTDGANVRFNGAGDVAGVYYQTIPPLESNGSNWLSTTAYDAYLFGVLAEVADYMMDDQALAKHQAKSSAILDMIRAADHRLTGPLRSIAK